MPIQWRWPFWGGSDSIDSLIARHFRPFSVHDITVVKREFPHRVRADVQRAVDEYFRDRAPPRTFCSVSLSVEDMHGISLIDCISPTAYKEPMAVPPEYEEVDIGEKEPIRCLENGLWLGEQGGSRFVALLAQAERCGQTTGLKFEIGTVAEGGGQRIIQELFQYLEESVARARSYRGKVLSLEQAENYYSGESCGIKVHRLKTVKQSQVILPARTLDLLDRNVIHFVRRRPELARRGQATRKGLLFYGPPGTGKTHTIHYLARALEGHTTLLISAEQVALLDEYMTLARLLQPSVVVIEDADLIARERTSMRGACDEVLLNRLLNEMDGLKEEADILFILTTNRPEALEMALASRPGRIDQAIEFPLPDADSRRRLVQLYSQGLKVSEQAEKALVERTDRVSAAFIKELVRRSVQFSLERDGAASIETGDVEQALEELLFSGGSLNLKLLGAERHGEN